MSEKDPGHGDRSRHEPGADDEKIPSRLGCELHSLRLQESDLRIHFAELQFPFLAFLIGHDLTLYGFVLAHRTQGEYLRNATLNSSLIHQNPDRKAYSCPSSLPSVHRL